MTQNSNIPNFEAYDIIEHVHRFATWAASRAAGTVKGVRFPVWKGRRICDAVGFRRLLGNPNLLPSQETMDDCHRQWRKQVIEAAEVEGVHFTHGMAAKLINVYFKTAYVNPVYASHPMVGALHPPIDRKLLAGLAARDVEHAKTWQAYRDAAWSRFDSDTYQEVILAIRALLGPGVPLWKIEYAWKGYQGKELHGSRDRE